MIKNYFLRHIQNAVGALGRLYATPVASLMTILVIAVALTLPVMLQILVDNGTRLAGRWDNVYDISVFLKQGISEDNARTLGEEIRSWESVEGVDFISSNQALKNFEQDPQFSAAVSVLDSNPLPHVLVVSPTSDATTPTAIQALTERLRAQEAVELAQSDGLWVNRLNKLLEVARIGVISAFVLLALAVTLIVGNTIRLDIENHRDEIIVTKLVGGSNAFIRRPFLYYGCWYGLSGGVFSWIMVSVVLWMLKGPIQELSALYQSDFGIQGLSISENLMVLGIGMGLGWIGAWIAAQRHMNRIEPR